LLKILQIIKQWIPSFFYLPTISTFGTVFLLRPHLETCRTHKLNNKEQEHLTITFERDIGHKL